MVPRRTHGEVLLAPGDTIDLPIAWTGQDTDTLYMTGPATTVFEGQIDIPDHL